MKSPNIKLLLGCAAIAALGALALEGCSSSDSSSGSAGTGGTSSGGTSSGGTSSGGKGGTAAGGTAAGGKGGTAAGGTGAGGSGTAGTGTAGTGTAGTGTAGSGAAGAAGAAGDGVDCTQFCADEKTTCTFGPPTSAPYATSEACMADCALFTPGAVAVFPDGPTTGDTYACRRWHLSKAATDPQPGNMTTHCPHTGKVSKNAYSDTSATGPCK